MISTGISKEDDEFIRVVRATPEAERNELFKKVYALEEALQTKPGLRTDEQVLLVREHELYKK
jgi:hypothetical protein